MYDCIAYTASSLFGSPSSSSVFNGFTIPSALSCVHSKQRRAYGFDPGISGKSAAKAKAKAKSAKLINIDLVTVNAKKKLMKPIQNAKDVLRTALQAYADFEKSNDELARQFQSLLGKGDGCRPVATLRGPHGWPWPPPSSSILLCPMPMFLLLAIPPPPFWHGVSPFCSTSCTMSVFAWSFFGFLAPPPF